VLWFFVVYCVVLYCDDVVGVLDYLFEVVFGYEYC